MKIEPIELHEAQALWNLQKKLDQETKFMLFEPEERKFNLSKTLGQIANTDFFIAAKDNGKLVGFLSAERGIANRNRHSAYIVVGILEAYQHQGLGRKFFEALEVWAREKQLKRLELTVHVNNYAAVALYQKSGFKIEGTKRQSMCVDGKLVDEFYMGKLFDEEQEPIKNMEK